MSEQFSFEQLPADVQASLRRQLGSSSASTTAIRPRKAETDIPMSAGQERMWFMHEALPNKATFNVFSATRVHGPLSLAALREALRRVIERHEPLRTSLRISSGTALQHLRPGTESEVRLRQLETSGFDDSMARDWLLARVAEPFDLANDPLLRAELLSAPGEKHVLLLIAHHVAVDGWSIGVLHRELGHWYAAALGQDAPELPPIRPYTDFAAEQSALRTEEGYATRVRRLREALFQQVRTIDPGGSLGSPGGRGVTVSRNLTDEISGLVRRIALVQRTTPFVVYLAAVGVALRSAFQSEVNVVGVPVAGRSDVRDENAIGYYSNTLLFPVAFAPDATVAEHLENLTRYANAVQDCHDVALQDVVREFGGAATESRQPFSVLFAYQDVPYMPLWLTGTATSTIHFPAPVAHAGLTVNIWPHSGPALEIEGDDHRFDQVTLQSMGTSIVRALRGFEDRYRQVGDIPLGDVPHGGLASLREAPAWTHSPPQEAAAVSPDLLQLWASFLEHDDVTISTNFFEKGGHSLLAAKLIAQVRELYGVNVPLRSFLGDPTPNGLARLIWSRQEPPG